MNPILAAGLLIGVLCGIWTFVMGLTGWYQDPAMASRFIVVATLIEVVVLIWGLRQTAERGRTYSGQVVAGTFMSIIGGLLIICASLLFTTVAYPDAIAAMGSSQTPLQNALAGFLGTFLTGVVGSAIIGIWIRTRGPRPSVASA